ncbi:MAG: IS21 family transposase [Desulfobacteraceae bacterium]|nr:IS21 family transposase [Desulfobacteraceae bacterium]
MELLGKGKNLCASAAKADMDEKTARKYRGLNKLPSEIKIDHAWRTREDPFDEVWEDVKGKLKINPGLEAKTLFEDLQRRHQGDFADGQLRTLQRRVKTWRALEGSPKEVFFPQVHKPGELCQSDFTDMKALGVTILGKPFEHLVYHFVLTYSNWETGTICFSESFESLSEGLQNAVWELGGVPERHRTDRLTAAVQKPDNPEEFTQRYRALLNHYGLQGHKTQPASPNENGDVEQRHYRFKKALEQSLMLRGSCDFTSRQDYAAFLSKLFAQLNAGRRDRFKEEVRLLRRLPTKRLDSCKRLQVRVGPSSTIRVNHNVYSVDSRLIRENVHIRLYVEHLEVWYAQQCIEEIPRLRGEGKHRIQYRHIIDWLVRKPGAFENYRYREELFPTHRFRMAYDWLKRQNPSRSAKEYLGVLHLAARQNEAAVDYALRTLIEKEQPISIGAVETIIDTLERIPSPTQITIAEVDLGAYDALLSMKEEVLPCYPMN